MFDIGFWEIALISILAMVVIGPERLPGAARTVGHWFGKTRRFVEGVKGDIESEFDTTELKRMLHNQEVQLKELQSKVGSEAGDIRNGFSYDLDDSKESDSDAEKDQSVDNDYLEFMDEDEEKDHEQIAAKKRENEIKFEEATGVSIADDTEAETNQAIDNDNLVASESDKKPQNDG